MYNASTVVIFPKRAFTLVEMLIVIGIICVLIGLLLPALGKARAQAQQLQCAALLQQWGQAFHLYAVQNKGALPHSGDRTRNPFAYRGAYWAGNPQAESSWLYVLPPLMKKRSWLDFANGQKPTGDIYQCPLAGQVNTDTDYGYSPSYWGYHSFVMNMFLDRDAPSLVPADVTPYPSFLRLAKARSASDTILIYESTTDPGKTYDGQGYPGTIACMNGLYPNDGPANFGDRHPHQRGKLGGNIVFLDGHIEWRESLWNLNHPIPAQPPVTDRLWWPY